MHSHSKLVQLTASAALMAAMVIPSLAMSLDDPDYATATSIETPTYTGPFTVSVDDNDDFYFTYADIDTADNDTPYLKLVAGSSIANLASDTPISVVGNIGGALGVYLNIEGYPLCQYKNQMFAIDGYGTCMDQYSSLNRSLAPYENETYGLHDVYLKNDHQDNGMMTYISINSGDYSLMVMEADDAVRRVAQTYSDVNITNEETVYTFGTNQVPATPKVVHSEYGGAKKVSALFPTRFVSGTDYELLVYAEVDDWYTGTWTTPVWFQQVQTLDVGCEGDNFDIAALYNSSHHFGAAYITSDSSNYKSLYYADGTGNDDKEIITTNTCRIDDISLLLMPYGTDDVEPIMAYTQGVADSDDEYNIFVYSRHMVYDPMEWYVCQGTDPELVFDSTNNKVYLFYIHDGSYYCRLVFDKTYEYQ